MTSENIKLSLYKFLNIENEEDYNKIPLRNQLDHTLAVIWALFSNEFDESNLTIDQINVGLQFLKRICTNGRYSPEIERGIMKLESLLQLKQSDSNLNPILLHVSRSTQTSSIKIKPGNDTIQAVKLNSYGNHLQNSLDFLFQKKISYQDNQVVTGDVAKFLANWRQEQMSLIQEEIRKLHTLEWLLHKFEKPEFFNQIFPAP